MGLITRSDLTQAHYDALSGYVSWTYNYSLKPEPQAVDWMNENGVEFVPMFFWTSQANGGSEENKYCENKQKDPEHPDFCGVEALVKTI
jgi:hypothetical protein